MKQSCEKCGAALAHDSDAFICSHECTFCPTCVEALEQRCPNCSGELGARPHRATD